MGCLQSLCGSNKVMESAEITPLHGSGETERGWMMLFGLPNALQTSPEST